MRRDFGRLADGPFDLLVVGGGIYGAWTAYDAALRGLRVALVERTDWAAGTSSASSKLIHGGLRYLETLRLGLVRRSVRERQRLARLAPHQVRPLRFAVPVYRGDRLGRLRLRAGLALYDLLAGGEARAAHRHRAYGPDGLRQRAGFLRAEGLLGGFTFGDCCMDDARLTLEIVDGAISAGAAAVNGADAIALLNEGGRVRGARVRDAETGEARDVEAAMTVNCAGPWAEGLLPDAARGGSRLTKGIHLVLPGLASDHAALLTARADGRIFFLIPWYGRTLLGTTDTDYDGDPDRPAVTSADADYLLREAGRVVDGRGWDGSAVIGRFVGLRALQRTPDAQPSRATREWTLEEPTPGLLLPVGGKYTSARADAALIVDRVARALGRSAPCATTERPSPWCPPGRFDEWEARAIAGGIALGLDGETARCCARRFGRRVEEVHRRVAAARDLGARLHPELPFCRAEVVHAAEEEMARTLHDVLRRRLPLLLLARCPGAVLADAAGLAGTALGWDGARRHREIEALRGAAG